MRCFNLERESLPLLWASNGSAEKYTDTYLNNLQQPKDSLSSLSWLARFILASHLTLIGTKYSTARARSLSVCWPNNDAVIAANSVRDALLAHRAVPDGRTNWSHAPRDESDAIRAVFKTSDALSINEKRSALNLMWGKNKKIQIKRIFHCPGEMSHHLI
jgi:hypothetical protein